jgi:hypothetical protein
VHVMSEQQEESCVVCESKGHRTTECPTIPASFTRRTCVYFLKKKSNVFNYFKKFKVLIKKMVIL